MEGVEVKITKWEIEGSPDELRQIPELRALFPTVETIGSTTAPENLEGLVPAESAEIVRRYARTPRHEQLLLNLLERVARSGQFVIRPGRSAKTEDGMNDYVMVYRRGPQTIGCLAYVGPSQSRVLVRLPAERAANFPGGQIYGNQGKYRVFMIVDTENDIDEALTMINAALEDAAAA
jgi:hypothetical protein